MLKTSLVRASDAVAAFPTFPGFSVSVSGNKQYVHSATITNNETGEVVKLEGKIGVYTPEPPTEG